MMDDDDDDGGTVDDGRPVRGRRRRLTLVWLLVWAGTVRMCDGDGQSVVGAVR